VKKNKIKIKKLFKCDCYTHLLEIEYEDSQVYNPEIYIVIYNIYNPKTGRKYKKPKLVGDITLVQPKSVDTIMKFLEDIVTEYTIRKNK